MFVDEIKPFSDKLNIGRHLDLPIFSTIFKQKSNRNFFTGLPPHPMVPRVESQHPQWANLNVRQALPMNKQDFNLAFGYELTPAAFFNFKNNLISVARIISRTPIGISFKQTGKMTSKKIRLFLTPISKISCPLFDYLNSKSNLNLPRIDSQSLQGPGYLSRLDA